MERPRICEWHMKGIRTLHANFGQGGVGGVEYVQTAGLPAEEGHEHPLRPSGSRRHWSSGGSRHVAVEGSGAAPAELGFFL